MPNPTRRTVLGAASILPMAARRSVAADSGPSVGVIGVGNRGSVLAKIIGEQTTARLAAVSDLSESRMNAASKLAPRVQRFQDFHDLLRSNVDAVVIATPVFLHAGHLEAAVQAGKHIYIEKPAASSVADCKKILRIVDSAPRSLNITFGFQRRYGKVYKRAKQAQDAGAIDKILWAQVQFIKSEATRQRTENGHPVSESDKIANWLAWQDLSGDLIVENNIHVIDVMNWFIGARPLKALGAGGRTRPGYGDNRDHGQVTFTYPDRVQGVLAGTTLASPGFRNVFEQFHGSKGTIETSENYWKLIRGGKPEIDEPSPRDITVDSLAAFVRRVAEKIPENTGASGVESTLTAIMGRLAMDRAREVTWEETLASE